MSRKATEFAPSVPFPDLTRRAVPDRIPHVPDSAARSPRDTTPWGTSRRRDVPTPDAVGVHPRHASHRCLDGEGAPPCTRRASYRPVRDANKLRPPAMGSEHRGRCQRDGRPPTSRSAQGLVLRVSYATVETWPVLCEVTARPVATGRSGPGATRTTLGREDRVGLRVVGMVQTPPPLRRSAQSYKWR